MKGKGYFRFCARAGFFAAAFLGAAFAAPRVGRFAAGAVFRRTAPTVERAGGEERGEAGTLGARLEDRVGIGTGSLLLWTSVNRTSSPNEW